MIEQFAGCFFDPKNATFRQEIVIIEILRKNKINKEKRSKQKSERFMNQNYYKVINVSYCRLQYIRHLHLSKPVKSGYTNVWCWNVMPPLIRKYIEGVALQARKGLGEDSNYVILSASEESFFKILHYVQDDNYRFIRYFHAWWWGAAHGVLWGNV